MKTVYVDIGQNSGDTATLSFSFNVNGGNNGSSSSGDMNFERRWDIKITQLECTNPSR